MGKKEPNMSGMSCQPTSNSDLIIFYRKEVRTDKKENVDQTCAFYDCGTGHHVDSPFFNLKGISATR